MTLYCLFSPKVGQEASVRQLNTILTALVFFIKRHLIIFATTGDILGQDSGDLGKIRFMSCGRPFLKLVARHPSWRSGSTAAKFYLFFPCWLGKPGWTAVFAEFPPSHLRATA
jgi:hypothetical protein